MRKIRNRLLITLVLFGVLSAAAAHAQTVSIGKLPATPIGKSVYDPPPAPTAGEPDVGQTSPNRTAQSQTRVSSTSSVGTFTPRIVTYADALRWGWLIWMAQYLNRLP